MSRESLKGRKEVSSQRVLPGSQIWNWDVLALPGVVNECWRIGSAGMY